LRAAFFAAPKSAQILRMPLPLSEVPIVLSAAAHAAKAFNAHEGRAEIAELILFGSAHRRDKAICGDVDLDLWVRAKSGVDLPYAELEEITARAVQALTQAHPALHISDGAVAHFECNHRVVWSVASCLRNDCDLEMIYSGLKPGAS